MHSFFTTEGEEHDAMNASCHSSRQNCALLKDNFGDTARPGKSPSASWVVCSKFNTKSYHDKCGMTHAAFLKLRIKTTSGADDDS